MSSKNKQRTYARTRAFSRRGREVVYESDGSYLLKLSVILLLGTLWLKFSAPLAIGSLVFSGFPLGLIIGLLLVSRLERLQYNRKIWYSTLLVVTVISYFVPAGIVI